MGYRGACVLRKTTRGSMKPACFLSRKNGMGGFFLFFFIFFPQTTPCLLSRVGNISVLSFLAVQCFFTRLIILPCITLFIYFFLFISTLLWLQKKNYLNPWSFHNPTLASFSGHVGVFIHLFFYTLLPYPLNEFLACCKTFIIHHGARPSQSRWRPRGMSFLPRKRG